MLDIIIKFKYFSGSLFTRYILYFVLSVIVYSCMPVRKSAPPPEQNHISFSTQDSLSRMKVEYRKHSSDSQTNSSDTILSKASKLLIKACNNYLDIDSSSPKAVEVLTIMASVYYNNNQFEKARSVYNDIINVNPQNHDAFDAMRMIAQSYYEEKRFDEAQEWYRKLSNSIPDEIDKNEARSRIAESIFRMAELLEEQEKYEEAATQYQRIAMEFPDNKLADISLFNAGLDYEKTEEWSKAILVFQKLVNMFEKSKLVPNAQFRTARCYENQAQWDQAAQTYLQNATRYPDSDIAPVSLYNAAICLENSKRLTEAATTLERFAQIYPNSNEAADALFKAGEIYGQIKDWPAVQRVNQSFMKHFGNDKNRIVQALCMTGIAFYMQDQEELALQQLQKTVDVYNKHGINSTVNSFYAARALFTTGEIYSNRMNKIDLIFQNRYRQQLAKKSSYLNMAIDAFTKVVEIGIAEWTTRSIFQAGQTYEDFAMGIFKQKRPHNQQLSDRLALELGIAQAVEKYLVSNSLHYHERNMKFALTENIEDQYVLKSRKKITQLPFIAGHNYLTLADIASQAENDINLEGFALIANKLQILQKIAPYQTRAIELFLKCLELGTRYQEHNEFFNKTSQSITKVSLDIGNIYADVVEIARSAPVPQTFDNYEMFIYKTKLLSQIEGYEDEAVTNYLKTIKISSAYGISDTNVSRARESIARILFNRARCYDLLCINAFTNPPFPSKISEDEKDEYKVQFEEIGLKFQEQAFKIYETILDYSRQEIASGQYVVHSYVRLFQNFPEQYGKREIKTYKNFITSGPQWKYCTDSVSQWYNHDLADSSWKHFEDTLSSGNLNISGFPDSTPSPLIAKNNLSDTLNDKANTVYIRLSFYLDNTPIRAYFYFATNGLIDLYLNGRHLFSDSLSLQESRKYDLSGKLDRSKNVIAMKVVPDNGNSGMYPLLVMETETEEIQPEVPNQQEKLTLKDVQIDTYKFPFIKNFSLSRESDK